MKAFIIKCLLIFIMILIMEAQNAEGKKGKGIKDPEKFAKRLLKQIIKKKTKTQKTFYKAIGRYDKSAIKAEASTMKKKGLIMKKFSKNSKKTYEHAELVDKNLNKMFNGLGMIHKLAKMVNIRIRLLHNQVLSKISIIAENPRERAAFMDHRRNHIPVYDRPKTCGVNKWCGVPYVYLY